MNGFSAFVAAVAVAIALTACSAPDGGGDAPSDTQAPTQSATPEPTDTSEAVSETPEPSPSGPPTAQLGEKVKLEDAVVRIDAVEKRKVIKSDYGDDLKSKDGGSLWLLSMWWKNTSNEAVEKVCWGPYSLDLRVFDTQDRELLLDDDSGMIPENECSDGLMTGQSGKWYQAFQGLKGAEPAYAILTDDSGYGESHAVVFDDSITLTYSE